MTGTNQNGKRAVETILVASGNYPLVNDLAVGDPLPGGGTVAASGEIPLMSVTNSGFVNLTEGQIGIFSGSSYGVRTNNTTLTPSDTYAEAPEIYIAVGTKNSQNPGLGSFPLRNNRPYEGSENILGRNYVVATGRVAAFGSQSVWNVGDVNAVNTQDLTEYTLRVAYHGQILDTENGLHSYEQNTFNYISPEYSVLGLTDDLDHLIQNLVYNINRQSKAFWGGASIWGANEPVISFAVAEVANASTDINNAAFDNGGIVPVFVRNGQTYSVSLSAAQVASLRAAIPATHGILTVDLTTAGNNAYAKYFTLMALDRDLVFDDRVMATKIRIDVATDRGFNTRVNLSEVSYAFEGEGKGRQWLLMYERTAGQRKYAQFQRQEFPFIEVPSNIVEGEYYNVYTIEHRSVNDLHIVGSSVSPKKTIILVPTCDTVTTASLEKVLNSWVTSVPNYALLNNGQGASALAVGTLTDYCI